MAIFCLFFLSFIYSRVSQFFMFDHKSDISGLMRELYRRFVLRYLRIKEAESPNKMQKIQHSKTVGALNKKYPKHKKNREKLFWIY